MDTDLAEIKDLTMIDILSLIAGGAKKKDACASKGISEMTFDRWLAVNKDARDAFISKVRAQIDDRYSQVTTTTGMVIDALVEKIRKRITDDEISISELMEFYKYLTSISGPMELQLGVLKSDDQVGASAELIISGPVLREGHHKITKTTVTMDFDVTEDPLVVDGALSTDPMNGEVLPPV